MFQERWFWKYFYKKCVDVLKNEKLKIKTKLEKKKKNTKHILHIQDKT